MTPTSTSLSRPAVTKLLIGAVLMLGLLSLFVALAADASAGGDVKITVNTIANIDDGECEGAPNDDEIGNCTLHEAIDAVNDGDADIINFHPPVFSKEQPGVIDLCFNGLLRNLPTIKRDVVIDSKNSGVILDGGTKDDDCGDPAGIGLQATDFDNGFDFELNGGKNFTVRNFEFIGIYICGRCGDDVSLGTIEITGVIIDNIGDFDGIFIDGTNLESLSITNSEISSNENDAIDVDVDACEDVDLDCKLSDSVIDISGNRLSGAVSCGDCADGADIQYTGRVNEDTKVTVSVSQNEVINGGDNGVRIGFDGCGSGGINFHVDENEEINGLGNDGVDIEINADDCEKEEICEAGVAGIPCECFQTAGPEPCPDQVIGGEPIPVEPGNTSDDLDVVVTVNGNGDIENHSNGRNGVDVEVYICCEESDSSATVEVNDNGRITGEHNGVYLQTFVCCGDDNVSDVSVNNNDEITGEGNTGILIDAFAGSSVLASQAGVAGGTGFDADDNTCTITIDGNNEIDGVGDDGVDADCFAGTVGFPRKSGAEIAGPTPPPTSSGDGNVSTVIVTNNNDIDGDFDGVKIDSGAGSKDGEGDDNLATATVSGNGEITGDDDDGVDIDIGAGSDIDEGDDNATEVVIEGNQEIGGNGGEGIDLDSFAGGVTDGSEGNSTSQLITQNGDIEGSGSSGEGIQIEATVCCDPENVNTIDILNNKGEITGHDDDGIDIETCCSVNIVTIMDNEGNIRGGDHDGLNINICDTEFSRIPSGVAGEPVEFADCLKDSVTHLTVINNSFSDSEQDGIHISGGTFEDEEAEIKSVISNNIIEGNGEDGIDIDSANGLNIGPANEIFENGTGKDDAGIEISWDLAACEWDGGDGNKFPANHNTITQNQIYDNAGLGIDLVGWDSDNSNDNDIDDCADLDNGVVGCDIFPDTAIAPNDCIAFPDLQTQSGDKLIGTTCSECHVEVFWADDDPSNNDGHGEGAEYIVTGTADVDGNFSIGLPCDLGAGEFTATATDKLKNTSEFAENLTTLGTGPCVTDTPVPPDETDTPVPPVPTATPEPTKTCGDVNMDGSVNSVDATLILQLKAGLISSLANESSADVDNDGNITSIDASLILQATAGLIDEGALTCP